MKVRTARIGPVKKNPVMAASTLLSCLFESRLTKIAPPRTPTMYPTPVLSKVSKTVFIVVTVLWYSLSNYSRFGMPTVID